MAIPERPDNIDTGLIVPSQERKKIIRLFSENYEDFRNNDIEEKRLTIIKFIPGAGPLKISGKIGRYEIRFEYSDLQIRFREIFNNDTNSFSFMKYTQYTTIASNIEGSGLEAFAGDRLWLHTYVHPLTINGQAAAVYEERYCDPILKAPERGIVEVWTAKRLPSFRLSGNGLSNRSLIVPSRRSLITRN